MRLTKKEKQLTKTKTNQITASNKLSQKIIIKKHTEQTNTLKTLKSTVLWRLSCMAGS